MTLMIIYKESKCLYTAAILHSPSKDSSYKQHTKYWFYNICLKREYSTDSRGNYASFVKR